MIICPKPNDFLIKDISIFTSKKDMAVYIAKNAYFDTIKGIKIHRVLPVEIWQVASTGSKLQEKN